MFMPMAFVLLGILGAFSTHAMSKKASTSSHQQGYRFISVLEPCRAEIMCTTEFGDVCQYENVNLWGKATETSPCNVPLYKISN